MYLVNCCIRELVPQYQHKHDEGSVWVQKSNNLLVSNMIFRTVEKYFRVNITYQNNVHLELN